MRRLLLALATLFAVLATLVECVLLHPIPSWVYVVAIAPLVLVALSRDAFVTRIGNPRRGVVSASLMIIALVALHEIPFSSRKPFLRDFRRIEIGMTRDEVDRRMEGYLVGTGWALPNAPRVELDFGPDRIVYRHSDDGRFNSDWGIVEFMDGRVVSTEFSPD